MRPYILPLLLLVMLPSCATRSERLRQQSDSLAAKAGMHRANVYAGDVPLLAYERLGSPLATLHIYIEGDDNGWLNGNMASDNTPSVPVALQLAVADPSPNVVYMARICQFGMSVMCERTSEPFSDAAIVAYQQAMNRWKGYPMELTGYSGGAAVALLVAARRQDVVAIRTVAGVIDTDALAVLHQVHPLTGSLNPASVINRTASIPQRHFVSDKDHEVPPPIVAGYQGQMPAGHCSAYNVVSSVTKPSDWRDIWPVLLSQPLPCMGAGDAR